MSCNDKCPHLVTVMKRNKISRAYCGEFDLLLKIRYNGTVKKVKKCKFVLNNGKGGKEIER